MAVWILCSLMVGSVSVGALVIAFGRQFKIFSKPSFRRQVQMPVPLLGGLAIILPSALVAAVTHNACLLELLACASPLIAIGIFDDVREISPRLKFVGQLTSAGLAVWYLPNGQLFDALAHSVLLGHFLAFIFICGAINAFNFLDGMDGQLGFFSCSFFMALAYLQPNIAPSSLAFAASVLGFLFWNRPSAKLYLGEVGSSFLGFAASVLALQDQLAATPWSSFWVLSALMALPYMDLIHCSGRRMLNGQKFWVGDREHFHHKLQILMPKGWPALLASLAWIGFSHLIALAIAKASTLEAKLLVTTAGVIACFFTYAAVFLLAKLWGRRELSMLKLSEHFLSAPPTIPIKLSKNCVGLTIQLQPVLEELHGQPPLRIRRVVEALRDLAFATDERVTSHLVEGRCILHVGASMTCVEGWIEKIQDLYSIEGIRRRPGLHPEGVGVLPIDQVERLLNEMKPSAAPADKPTAA